MTKASLLLILMGVTLLFPMPALAWSWGCTHPATVFDNAYKDATWVALPLSIVLYTILTKRFPTLPVITALLYVFFSIISSFMSSGLYATLSCPQTITNFQVLEDPRPYIAATHLALIAVLTSWQLNTQKTKTTKNKPMALKLHLGFILAPAAYALLILSRYTYTYPSPDWF